MRLPTKQECKILIDITFRVPYNIVKHSIVVNRVAMFVAQRLKAKGIQVDLDLVDRASILHDCLKVIDISPEKLLIHNEGANISIKDRKVWHDLKNRYFGLTHDEAAYTAFKDNYPQMADVIRSHGFSDPKNLDTWEKKIVSYADKRVKHEEIVSMRERFDDGYKRYADIVANSDPNLAMSYEKDFFSLEKEIFNIIGLDPDMLEAYIKKEDKEGDC